MPLRDFRMMSDEEVRAFDPLKDITEETGPGYVLLVTLLYPASLHVEHNSFPLAPHQMDITEADLSPYAKKCWMQLNPSARGKMHKYSSRKLTSTFLKREKYWCHGLSLKYYLQKGLELVEIHSIITFHQEPFLRSFVDMCTANRANAKTKVEATRWKLIVNR